MNIGVAAFVASSLARISISSLPGLASSTPAVYESPWSCGVQGPGSRRKAVGPTRSAGEVERGGRVIGVEPEVALHGVGCRERLDVDAARAEPLERFRVGPEAAVRARADDQPLRQLVEDVGEVVEHEAVPVPAPPVADDPAG